MGSTWNYFVYENILLSRGRALSLIDEHPVPKNVSCGDVICQQCVMVQMGTRISTFVWLLPLHLAHFLQSVSALYWQRAGRNNCQHTSECHKNISFNVREFEDTVCKGCIHYGGIDNTCTSVKTTCDPSNCHHWKAF